jgi:hypothetical protein
VTLQTISRDGNLQVVHDSDRKFPAILITADSLASLLELVNEECPGSLAADTLTEWLESYERTLAGRGIRLPYVR